MVSVVKPPPSLPPPRVPAAITLFFNASALECQSARENDTAQTQPSNRQPEGGAFPAAAGTASEESVTAAGKHGGARLQPADKPSALVCVGLGRLVCVCVWVEGREGGGGGKVLISPLFPLRQVRSVWGEKSRVQTEK